MKSDLVFQDNADVRVCWRWFAVAIAVVVGLTGCMSTNGALVKLGTQDVVGPVASVEKVTTTTTTTNDKGAPVVVSVVTEKTTQMTPYAARFELNKMAIAAVTKSAVAKAENQNNGLGMCFGDGTCSRYPVGGSYGPYSTGGQVPIPIYKNGGSGAYGYQPPINLPPPRRD